MTKQYIYTHEPPVHSSPRKSLHAAMLTFTALALGFGGIFASGNADASICGKHSEIKKILGDRYKESQRALGMVDTNGVVEVFTSNKGTWSILLTSTSGRTCVIAAGHTWQELNQVLAGPAA